MGNIGANGAYIRCEKPLRPKERFTLHIMAPNRSTLSARVEVAWLQVRCNKKDIPPCGMGVRFTRASGNVRQFIKYFVAEHYEKEKPTAD
jgi:Tfp pilus assembly protein PilZ